jgi:hypothetical protein
MNRWGVFKRIFVRPAPVWPILISGRLQDTAGTIANSSVGAKAIDLLRSPDINFDRKGLPPTRPKTPARLMPPGVWRHREFSSFAPQVPQDSFQAQAAMELEVLPEFWI